MSQPTLEAELDEERSHLAESRGALHRMRLRAEALYATGANVSGDPFGAESLGRALARRVAELADNPDTPLFFGRLDFEPDGLALAAAAAQAPALVADDGDGAATTHYIGRRHVTDDRGEPLVLDWRAPLSRAFYRASAKDPQGVATRRRFGFAGGVLTSFEDEHLDRGEELGTASRILTAEIERPRVGPMRDIVATIQPEQDELVRAALAESICVQGAPGTGKTAVGLHRAAYLLYLHRDQLRRSGVLILGPNSSFLHYIAAVLPALGELEVAQSTVDELVARVPVRATEPVAVATLKHDARLAQVLRRALYAQLGKPSEAMTVKDDSYRWRISVEALRRVVDDIRREGLPYGTGRERLRARVVALLQRQVEARGDSPGDAWLRRMARATPVTAFLDACWPAVTPEGLVHALLSGAPFPAPGSAGQAAPGGPDAAPRDLLAVAAEGILTDAEQALLRWQRPARTPKSTRWTAADAVLIDEAAGLIDRETSFGHIVIDEAQDLSPMQYRAVARRIEHGSVTLLGDLAQGTSPWAATDWATPLAHLGKPGTAVVPLTTGFRVPEAVVRLANRLLPALRVDVPTARSLRSDGWLHLRQVPEVSAAVVDAVRAALTQEGSVGVIAADDQVPALARALADAGIATGDADADAPVTVLPATLAKGLEYDHVIVAEPARIVAAEERGLNRLYVVLTRAVSRLDVLHAEPLPEALRPAG
jgi:DNA helicase IV